MVTSLSVRVVQALGRLMSFRPFSSATVPRQMDPPAGPSLKQRALRAGGWTALGWGVGNAMRLLWFEGSSPSAPSRRSNRIKASVEWIAIHASPSGWVFWLLERWRFGVKLAAAVAQCLGAAPTRHSAT